MALPGPATGGRLLLLLKSLSDGMEISSSKRAKKKSSYDVGSLVQAEVGSNSLFRVGNHMDADLLSGISYMLASFDLVLQLI